MKDNNLIQLYKRPGGNDNFQEWAMSHANAITLPKDGHEKALVQLLTGWLHYADAYARQYRSSVGDDRVLGEPWAAIGSSIRQLLNGDIGRLDGGTLDGVLCAALKNHGFDPDDL